MPASVCPECGGRRDSAGICPNCPPAPDATRSLTPPVPETDAGHRFGPYLTQRILGEGGMGTVYLAEQREPIHRQVALKVVKHGLDSREVIARFESERQALALMDHPNIARVLDAGATADGVPYFVMEYVRGIPITEYCDRHRLTTRQRLELFCDVCYAIHHAHQRGVIHRDIKPSNVLVELVDGKPLPKVIDFGVAKATRQRLTARTLFTHMGMMVVIAQGQALKQPKLIKVLEELAADTGGLPFRLYKPDKIREVFAEISRDLQHTYMLAWRLPDDAGSSWHPIRISVEGAEGAVIRTRQGYWPE